MRRGFMALAALFLCQPALAADSPCLSKYKTITNQFYVYNTKSAVSNAVMDRIATYYVEGSDVSKIRPSDAKAWRAAIEDFIAAGQPMLQNFLEYKALGCSPDQQLQLNEQIDKITDDLKQSRARLNSLISGLPASAFR
jgi:hypothetical protein